METSHKGSKVPNSSAYETRNLVFKGDEASSLWALTRVLPLSINSAIVFGNTFEDELRKTEPRNSVVILDTLYDTSSQAAEYVWKKLRLNEEELGKELAGLPVLALGMDKGFTERAAGRAFAKYSSHHRYLTKPLNLREFLQALNTVSRIDPADLPIINECAPENLSDILEHELVKINPRSFDYDRPIEEIRGWFRDKEVDLKLYERCLKRDKRKAQKFRENLKKLRIEIIRRRGNIWG